MSTAATVTGMIRFACGERIAYDDANPAHKANRLRRSTMPALVECPEHGPETAWAAVSGPARLLWPDPVERADVLREIAWEREDMFGSDPDEPCRPLSRVGVRRAA